MQEPKLRFDLLPPHGITEVARALTIGRKHDAGEEYGEPDYLENPKPVRYHLAALMRHLFAYLRGEERDPDGQLHLASVAARALMILEISRNQRENVTLCNQKPIIETSRNAGRRTPHRL
jgi:hypothetical protein